MRKIALLLSFMLVMGCATAQSLPFHHSPSLMSQSDFLNNHPYAEAIVNGELTASPNAQKVLVSARQMVENGEIIKGGCWDYLNAAWNRAGFDGKKRKTIFKTNIRTPPYANLDDIQAGDWLYHINYSYHEIEHSGMFVGWLDKENAIGLTLSYAGEKRGEPARYKPYDLSGVYQIFRAE